MAQRGSYLPTTSEPFADLGVVYFRFSSGNLASFDLRPHNERVHWPCNVCGQLAGCAAISLLRQPCMLLEMTMAGCAHCRRACYLTIAVCYGST